MLTEVWRVTLLGALRAEQGRISIDRFRTRKTASLFAYLDPSRRPALRP